jgi:tRNA-dihydrouridine synthase
MNNFWQDLKQQLKRALVGLAPMDGITDQPFRHIVKKYGQPDVIYTEFVNVEGLCHNAEALLRPLLYDNSQRPIVAQIYGKTPNSFRQAAILVCQLGFDGIDLNMGCPSKSVAGGGAGAALIKNPKLAQAIIRATQQGVQDWVDGKNCSDCPDFSDSFCELVEKQRQALDLDAAVQFENRQALPVSIKTRLGYDQPVIQEWLPFLLGEQPAAVAIHGRTLKQGYSGQANWEQIGQAAQLAKEQRPDTLILGNGDVTSFNQAQEIARIYKVDGVLMGRAAQGNPFVFAQENPLENLDKHEQAKTLAKVALEHAQFYEETFCSNEQDECFFLPMRKHLAWYVKGIPHAKEIRQRLVQTSSSQAVAQILQSFSLLD